VCGWLLESVLVPSYSISLSNWQRDSALVTFSSNLTQCSKTHGNTTDVLGLFVFILPAGDYDTCRAADSGGAIPIGKYASQSFSISTRQRPYLGELVLSFDLGLIGVVIFWINQRIPWFSNYLHKLNLTLFCTDKLFRLSVRAWKPVCPLSSLHSNSTCLDFTGTAGLIDSTFRHPNQRTLIGRVVDGNVVDKGEVEFLVLHIKQRCVLERLWVICIRGLTIFGLFWQSLVGLFV